MALVNPVLASWGVNEQKEDLSLASKRKKNINPLKKYMNKTCEMCYRIIDFIEVTQMACVHS